MIITEKVVKVAPQTYFAKKNRGKSLDCFLIYFFLFFLYNLKKPSYSSYYDS